MHTATPAVPRLAHRFAIGTFGLVLLGLICAGQAQAALLVGFIADRNGKPVEDAVLYATPLDAALPPLNRNAAAAEVAQENHNFTPYVTVIRTGSSVRFPNRDPHDHHLKSFSEAKPFELRVYSKKEEPAPIVFDKSGEVALVCHLHDWMRGYIFVVDTPYAVKTDKSGNALLKDLPPGRYEVKAWAPTMLVPPAPQTVEVTEAGSTSVTFKLNYTPKPAPRPRSVSSSYYY